MEQDYIKDTVERGCYNCMFYTAYSETTGYCTAKFKDVKSINNQIMALNDNSPMPYGKYKGKLMENVPASYLMWLYDEGKCNEEVRDYIKDNLDVLKEEIKRENKNRS